MKTLIPTSTLRALPISMKRGFALIVTLSLMILLTVIAVGLLSLSAVTLRSTSASSAQTIARANAKMAMMIAIGELQKQTGPDQRVTLTSEMPFGNSTKPPVNRNWSGAVSVKNLDPATKAKDSNVNWLVSGMNLDPAKALVKSAEWNKGDALQLGTYFEPGSTTKMELLAPLVNLTQGGNRGRYAWWISDEATKARVDLAAPSATPTNDREKLTRSQAPLEPGLKSLGDTWKDFGPDGALNKQSLISMETASLATSDEDVPTEYLNDLTTGGFGVPTDVVDGGMKVDLSLKDKAGLINFAKDAAIKVSGFHTNGKDTTPNLVDGNPNTSWITQADGTKSVEFTLAEEQTIGCIQFLNGWRDNGIWKAMMDNYRVETFDGRKWIEIAKFDILDGEHNFARDFHTYGLEWNEKELVFYFNGKAIRREKNAFCHSEAPIWLSLAIIAWAGKVSDAIDGTFMEVDYVRVYQPK